VGRLRERNEDAYLIRDPVFAVADGMGGHRGGDVASALALESLDAPEGSDEDSNSDPFAGLLAGIKEANRRVLERGESDAALKGMGTTLTAVLAEDDRAHVAHVGDSRAYLLRGGMLQQLTEDHTLVQRMVREGRLKPDEAETHPQRSILTRALGIDDDLEVDQLTLDVHPGDRLLICSDGLTSMVSRERIQEILLSEPDQQLAADRLVEVAIDAGGDDNVTVIVLDVLDEGDGPSSGEHATVVSTSSSDGRPARTGSLPASAQAARTVGPAEGAGRRKRRRRAGRIAMWTGILVAVVVASLVGLRLYVDRQWYVGDNAGRVAIYNGIPAGVLGFELHHVQETTDLDTAEALRLGPWRALRDGITVNSLSEAEGVVEQIRRDILGQEAPPPTEPSPSPSPTASPSA